MSRLRFRQSALASSLAVLRRFRLFRAFLSTPQPVDTDHLCVSANPSGQPFSSASSSSFPSIRQLLVSTPHCLCQDVPNSANMNIISTFLLVDLPPNPALFPASSSSFPFRPSWMPRRLCLDFLGG